MIGLEAPGGAGHEADERRAFRFRCHAPQPIDNTIAPRDTVPAPRKRTKRPARPRVPLPRQTGGVHEDKTKRPWRRRKHKAKAPED
jgi:hypothetical protein